jgi:hypothetical protein
MKAIFREILTRSRDTEVNGIKRSDALEGLLEKVKALDIDRVRREIAQEAKTQNSP